MRAQILRNSRNTILWFSTKTIYKWKESIYQLQRFLSRGVFDKIQFFYFIELLHSKVKASQILFWKDMKKMPVLSWLSTN